MTSHPLNDVYITTIYYIFSSDLLRFISEL